VTGKAAMRRTALEIRVFPGTSQDRHLEIDAMRSYRLSIRNERICTYVAVFVVVVCG
jgi:hypothetical protein